MVFARVVPWAHSAPYPAVSLEPATKWPERVFLFTLHKWQASPQDTEVRRVLPFSSESPPREDLVYFPTILLVILSSHIF
jgi:hypothetical protein